MAGMARAQSPVDGAHYPAGLNGIRAGGLPEPGFHLRDDNWFYVGAGKLDVPALGSVSSGIIPSTHSSTLVYEQSPELLWVATHKLFGAQLGIGVRLFFEHRQVSSEIGKVSTPGGGHTVTVHQVDREWNLGDTELELLRLGWHGDHFDATLGYSLWVPTGKYDEAGLANTSANEWTHMISLGSVWYPSVDKSWAVSCLQNLEINSAQTGNEVESNFDPGSGFGNFKLVPKSYPCSTYTAELAVDKAITTAINVGLCGYFQHQFAWMASSDYPSPYNNSSVAGVGPEIKFNMAQWGMTADLRYVAEFWAERRFQGHLVNLSLTKAF